MVSGGKPRRYFIALALSLALFLLHSHLGGTNFARVALAGEPITLMIQVRSQSDIAQLSSEFQLRVIAALPVLRTYLVQTATPATLDGLAVDVRVLVIQRNDLLSTFGAQQRSSSINDFEALQRYFGFGNGGDDSDVDNSGEKLSKKQKSAQTPRKDGPPDQVLVIYQDQQYKREWLDWGLRKVKLDKVQKYANGSGVTVAILDTGADLAHPQLIGHLVAGYDFVDGDQVPNDEPNGLDDDEDGQTDEGSGHGTHIANTIAMIAPAAKIMPVRVLNSDGGGTLFDIVSGIVYAVDHGAQVINMSFSAVDNSPFLEAAVNYALEHRVLLVAAAAGADGYLEFPAAYDHVIAVGATRNDDHIASFSEAYASEVDIFAPGELIYSAYYGGRTAWWTGTSMAAPFVAGSAALMVDYCKCSPDIVRSVLLKEVNNVKPKFKQRGRLNLEKIFKKLAPAWQPCDAGKPQALTFLYTGEACTASSNRQSEKFICSGLPASEPAQIQVVKDADKIRASLTYVRIGELLTFTTTEQKLKSDLEVNLGGQQLKIHTSCSSPIAIGEQFGSLRLVKFVPEGSVMSASAITLEERNVAHNLFLPLVTR